MSDLTTDARTQTEQESWIDRIELTVAAVLQLGIFAITVSAFIDQQWFGAFTGIAVLLLTLMPAMIERRLKVPLPVEFTLITCVFLFASFVLGEVRDFYEKFWWWDILLHGVSALVIGIIGFLGIYVFYMTHRIRIAPGYVALFTFALAVTVGTVWEIFEFLMDWYFGLNMQRSGLVDTMTDLMINAIGASLAAAIGYYYVKDEDSLLGRRLIRGLVEKRRREHSHDKT